MNVSINTICMFRGRPMNEAFQIMQRHGFDTFELWMIKDEEVDGLRKLMDEYGMKISAACPDKFILNDPSERDAYEKGLINGIRKIKALGGHALITQVGQNNGSPREEQHQSIVDGLKRMAPILEAEGVTLLVEPLNDVRDHKGYYLTDSNEGFEIIREVNSPNVRLLFDIYHQVHMGEDVLTRIKDNIDLIAHFHVAGHPLRDDDLKTHFDYAPVFEYIHGAKVAAPVGLELNPRSPEQAEALLEAMKAYK